MMLMEEIPHSHSQINVRVSSFHFVLQLSKVEKGGCGIVNIGQTIKQGVKKEEGMKLGSNSRCNWLVINDIVSECSGRACVLRLYLLLLVLQELLLLVVLDLLDLLQLL